jgi:hypothetical protein
MRHMTSIVLTHPSAGPGATPLALALPPDLLWVDQYGWQQVAQSKEYTTTGALVLESWAKQAGQPMALQGTQDRAWCARGTLATLRSWAAQPGLVLSLAHRGTTYTVAFDHEQRAIEAEPLTDLLQGGQSRYTVRNELGAVVLDTDVDYFDPRDTDPFSVTLRFVIL